jgi:hypothetical protein
MVEARAKLEGEEEEKDDDTAATAASWELPLPAAVDGSGPEEGAEETDSGDVVLEATTVTSWGLGVVMGTEQVTTSPVDRSVVATGRAGRLSMALIGGTIVVAVETNEVAWVGKLGTTVVVRDAS